MAVIVYTAFNPAITQLTLTIICHYNVLTTIRNTMMADSVKDVHMQSQNTMFSIKIAKSI